ncbi:MAG: peptidylprolyl isomerase [Bacilli bacterium]|nr:peptidylprolyl isomerase [Bacilli bacterium]
MKKSKLSLGLVTSFIAAMSLTACNEVTKKDGALVTFTPYGGGEAVEVVSDAMYQKYRKSTDGISKFYNQILEVLIRYEYQNGKLEGALDIKDIEAKADSDVKAQKQKAKDAASTNGTTYDKEWDAILENYGVENAKELKEVFIYNREKEDITKWYLNSNIDQLRKEFIGVDKDGNKVETKAESALPYHIRHILVKTESGAKDFDNGAISATEANHLFNAISKLKDGKQSFAQVAYDESDDGSGKDSYGDVGIMTALVTSGGTLQMVSEFQLGIYAYDAILTGKNNQAINDGLGVNGKYKDTEKTIAETYKEITDLVKVPYAAVESIYKYKDMEKDDYGNELSEGNPLLYPRNIIWNKYFNHHQAFVITNAQPNVGDNKNGSSEADAEATAAQFKNLTTTTYDDLGARFQYVENVSANENEKVLTDGEGNVIIGVRSEYGIHLMVIQKSIYDYNDPNVSLEEYYTTEVPSNDNKDYPRNEDGSEKSTYVNFINTTNTNDYNTRATKVKDQIKQFDSTYDYRLYESLMNKYAANIKFNGEEGKGLDKAIERYLEVTRATKSHNQEDKLNGVWESYLELLELQEDTRDNFYAYEENKYRTTMVPEGCAVNFHNGGADYEEGGKCYYGK